MSRARALSVFEKSLWDNLHIDFPNMNKVSGWMWWKRFGDFDLKILCLYRRGFPGEEVEDSRGRGRQEARWNGSSMVGTVGWWAGNQAVGLRPGSVQRSTVGSGSSRTSLCPAGLHLWNNVSHGPSLLELLWRLCGLINLKHCVLVHKNV